VRQDQAAEEEEVSGEQATHLIHRREVRKVTWSVPGGGEGHDLDITDRHHGLVPKNILDLTRIQSVLRRVDTYGASPIETDGDLIASSEAGSYLSGRGNSYRMMLVQVRSPSHVIEVFVCNQGHRQVLRE
jgi:hypothetical protein